jgi:hypothetical protein
MARKSTLYEMLRVSQDADPQAIQAAYQQRVSELESTSAASVAEEIDARRRSLHLAYTTLCNPASRSAYDARLTLRAEEAAEAAAALRTNRRNTARAGAAPSTRPLDDEPALHEGDDDGGRRRLLVWGLGIVLLAMLAPLASHLGAADRMERELTAMAQADGTVRRRPDGIDNTAALRALERAAEERLDLQAFFHEHGMRAASRDEIALLKRKMQDDAREKARAESLAARAARRHEMEADVSTTRALHELARQNDARRYQEEREREAYIRQKEREEEIRQRAAWSR